MNLMVLQEENEHLKTLLAEAHAALAESEEARRRLEAIVGQLNHEKFGAKSEKLHPDQYHLPLEDVAVAQGVLDAAQEKAQRIIQGRSGDTSGSGRRNRGHLPAHLPRVERIIEPESTLCPCGCGEMARIGEDVSERLDVVPAQLRVLVTRRPKYACRRCSGAVVQAHAPEHVVPGGLPTEALIAQVIVAKFGDHLPFYRQAEIYARQGIQLDRATLGNWAGRACFHLKPVASHMRRHLADADRLFMDETTAPVLDPGRGKVKKGFFWAIACDDRGHGGQGPPIVLFHYAPGRGGEHAERFLQGFSRFFRDHFELEFNVRKLARNGVKLVSITQEMGDDPMHVMMRQIMALFDEYQSKENAKHVLRAMNENARQGFWNGALPPIGYRIVAAEQRGAKLKKKLEIDPLHADTVRLIYRLFLEGDGVKGPMGVKAITCYLNERRLFTRDGGRWGLAQIHAILTRTTYIGEHRFNTRSHKDREKKPENEVAIMACPPLIDRETFEVVQARLKSRDPRMTPARVTSGPTLLTGICFCAKCGGAMTLRTGRGSAGGTYRYYTCSTKARQGKTGCEGRSIPMDKLDDLVAHHLEDRLLQPERLETILASVLNRRQERTERRREHLAELHKRISETEQRLNRLYDAIETGVAELDDTLKERVASLKAIQEQAANDAARTEAALANAGNQAVGTDRVKAFARVARERIRLAGGGYRREHLRALAQRIEVADKEVRIMGSKSELLCTLLPPQAGNRRQTAFRVLY